MAFAASVGTEGFGCGQSVAITGEAMKPKPSKLSVPFQVYCRIKPTRNGGAACVKKVSDTGVKIQRGSRGNNWAKTITVRDNGSYHFKLVFDENSGQEAIFRETAFPLIQDLLLGKSGLLMTYGAISSGKTYTMIGNPPKECGLLPRTLDALFSSIGGLQARKYAFRPDGANGFSVSETHEALLEEYKDMTKPRVPEVSEAMAWKARVVQNLPSVPQVDKTQRYAVFVSYVEICNNNVYDLLEDVSKDTTGRQSAKQLREDKKGCIYVGKGTEIEAKSSDEVFRVLCIGNNRKRMRAVALNNSESSRGHTIFTIRLVSAPVDLLSDDILRDASRITVSQLSLVDLAGGERAAYGNTSQKQIKEAGFINNSLMMLRNCIEALRGSQRNEASRFVPYRGSRLTYFLKNYFTDGKIHMIVCIDPRHEDLEDNLRALKFGTMTQEVNSCCLAEEPSFPAVGDVHSAIPVVILDEEQDEKSVKGLIQILQERQKHRELLSNQLLADMEKTRERIHHLEVEYETSKARNKRLENELKHREDCINALDGALIEAQNKVSLKSQQITEQEENNRWLEEELRSVEQMLAESVREKLELKDQLEEKLKMEEERMKHMLEEKLAMKQAELEAKMCLTEEKIQLLRDIINSKDSAELVQKSVRDVVPFKAQGTTTEPEDVRENPQDQMHGLRADDTNVLDLDACKKPSPEYGNFRNPPVANPKHSRAHTSMGFVWIQHRPKGSIDTGTVLNPTIAKKKEVTKLKMKDLKRNAAKYMLMHQEQDFSGGVETQLVKGNIIPSSAGGAQVIFNEVETVQQHSPPGK